jgi:hypothetical protein
MWDHNRVARLTCKRSERSILGLPSSGGPAGTHSTWQSLYLLNLSNVLLKIPNFPLLLLATYSWKTHKLIRAGVFMPYNEPKDPL